MGQVWSQLHAIHNCTIRSITVKTYNVSQKMPNNTVFMATTDSEKKDDSRCSALYPKPNRSAPA